MVSDVGAARSRTRTCRGSATLIVAIVATAAKAFTSIDAMHTQMLRTGAPSDAIAMAVVDEHGDQVARPGDNDL